MRRRSYISIIVCSALFFSGCSAEYSGEINSSAANTAGIAGTFNDENKTAPETGAMTTVPEIAADEKIVGSEIYNDIMESDAGGYNAPDPQPGLLTGGEWNDNENWHDWVSLYQSDEDWDYYKNYWRVDYDYRAEIKVTSDGEPIKEAEISYGGIVKAVTDNNGTAYVFFREGNEPEEITASFGGVTESKEITPDRDQTIEIELGNAQNSSGKTLDLMIMCDTTGSMGDELSFLQKELEDVVLRVKGDNGNIPVRISANFYRDEGDDYVIREYPFTQEINEVINIISEQCAEGGGDTPEAVHTALDSAVNNHDWSEGSVKIMFLILDAPPHDDPQIIDSVNSLTEKAASIGIRIIPVASSGTDKPSEYLFRTMAFYTGGTYVFLNDESGIGYAHEEPAIGDYQTEKLNDIMVRIVNKYLS